LHISDLQFEAKTFVGNWCYNNYKHRLAKGLNLFLLYPWRIQSIIQKVTTNCVSAHFNIIVVFKCLYNNYMKCLHPHAVQLVGAELQIMLRKTSIETNWSNIGILLPANGVITLRCTEKQG